MRLLSEIASRARSLGSLLTGRREDLELDEEIRFHLESETQKNIAAGLDPREARRRASLKFGGEDRMKEEARAARGIGFLEDLLRDLRVAGRSLARTPVFSLTIVLTLATGIGATVAIFSVANGVLLRPLPYSEPGQVVTVWASWDNFPEKTWLSVPEYQLFHQENRTLQDLAIYTTNSTTFTTPDDPEWVGSATVTPNTFELLGVAPVVGRVFSWEEAREPSTAGVLIAHRTWTRRYGADPAVIGTVVEIDGIRRSILGVLPEEFVLPVDYASTSPSEVYFPQFVDLESPAPDLEGGGSHSHYGVGRLREGLTAGDAQADFDRVMGLVEPVGLYSLERRFAPRVYPAQADIVGSARSTILTLLGRWVSCS